MLPLHEAIVISASTQTDCDCAPFGTKNSCPATRPVYMSKQMFAVLLCHFCKNFYCLIFFLVGL